MLLDRARTAYRDWKARPAGFSFARQGVRRTRQTREILLPDTSIKLLSFNIQAGIGSQKFGDYITGSWKHLVAHPRSVETIEQIAEVLSHFDVVGLQEVDGGSLRSRNMNQLMHLASLGDFAFWHQQLNRNLGRLGQFSNGFLSRHQPLEVKDHRLPGLPGRGAIIIKYGHPIQPLVVVVAHLALGEKVRNTQLAYLTRLLEGYKYVVMMGDFNCRLEHLERACSKEDANPPCVRRCNHQAAANQAVVCVDSLAIRGRGEREAVQGHSKGGFELDERDHCQGMEHVERTCW